MSNRLYYSDVKLGSSTWIIISSKNIIRQVYRENIIPRPVDNQCSYYSKLEGYNK